MTDAPIGKGRGLTATELALAAAELAPALCGAEVLDASPIVDCDDLLLVLQREDGKLFLHIALGQDRARIAPTSRRFRRDEQQPGPRTDALRKHVQGARIVGIEHEAGERRLELQLKSQTGQPLRLVVELFSARGLWALCTENGTVLELSRPVTTAVRTMQHGSHYAPPPPRTSSLPDAATDTKRNTDPPPRFAPPVLAAIDAHFAPADERHAHDADRQAMQHACDRAIARANRKALGLRQQLAEADRSSSLRQEADLMLAYMHGVQRGAASMAVPDPTGDGTVSIDLDPALPVQVQVRARYERARRLDDGRAIAEQRLAATEGDLAALQAMQQQVGNAAPHDGGLVEVRSQLRKLGLLPKPPVPPSVAVAAKAQKDRTKGENVRRYTSAEGYEILVGRDNQQNDRLSLRIANGNDLWLHVGGGRPGSHVIVRLPKGKTASLDTLLDAGTLAVHFSKARGERTIDVLYTLAKNVKKPKGLPPGAVVPSQTKTITVRLDEARLQQLLDGTPEE